MTLVLERHYADPWPHIGPTEFCKPMRAAIHCKSKVLKTCQLFKFVLAFSSMTEHFIFDFFVFHTHLLCRVFHKDRITKTSVTSKTWLTLNKNDLRSKERSFWVNLSKLNKVNKIELSKLLNWETFIKEKFL